MTTEQQRAFQKLRELDKVFADSVACDEDERVKAWHMIASHPFFRECYGSGGPLIDAMLAKLDAA